MLKIEALEQESLVFLLDHAAHAASGGSADRAASLRDRLKEGYRVAAESYAGYHAAAEAIRHPPEFTGCQECGQPLGEQHKPSCARQGTVTTASDNRDGQVEDLETAELLEKRREDGDLSRPHDKPAGLSGGETFVGNRGYALGLKPHPEVIQDPDKREGLDPPKPL